MIKIPQTINELKQTLLKYQTDYNESNNIIKLLITDIKKSEDPSIDLISKLKEILKSDDDSYIKSNNLYNKYKSQYLILISISDKINKTKREISIAEKKLQTYNEISPDNIPNLKKILKTDYDAI